MTNLKIENVNPKNRKTSDCVIRAIAKASGKDYLVVLKDLYDLSVKTGYMLNDKHCYEKLLEKYGFYKYKQPKKSDNSKYLVGEIDRLVRLEESAVISCAHHLTCYVDGDLIDIWDCRYKTIGNYWVKGK